MRGLPVLLLSALWMAAAGTAVRAEDFDKPVRQTVLDLGPSPDQPDYPDLHRHLSCDYFPRFMVKQLDDDGNKGALKISITRLPRGTNVPCTQANRRGDIIVSDGSDYYWGVKGGLVILVGADGLDGGMNFDVYSAKNGRKVFEDDLLMLKYKSGLDFDRESHGQLSLRYRRVIHAACSIPKDGAACWKKIQTRAGFKDAPMPKCDYSIARDDPADPSVIFYPVKVELFPLPKRRALSQDVKCVAAE